jgi:hypothetical protein
MTETKICGLPGGGRWVLEDGRGQGGFLDPPGYPTHRFAFLEYRGSRSTDYESAISVDTAGEYSWVPAAVKGRARRLLAEHPPQCTEEWLRSVYGYFRGCYSPDGEDRNVSRCLIVKPNPDGDGYVLGPFGRDGHLDELPPADRHLAVMQVRRFFPDHEPREDLIANPPPWGSKAD